MHELTEFLIIRHGQAEANITSLTCGLLDSPLTELGYEQAHSLGQSLSQIKNINFGIIAHSALSRSKETAKVLSTYLPNLKLLERSALNERNFGKWDGRPWQETFAELKKGIVPPEGESPEIFVDRVRTEIGLLIKETVDVPIIIAHGGTFYGLGCLIQKQSINIENCAAYHFKANGSTWDTFRIEKGLSKIESPFE